MKNLLITILIGVILFAAYRCKIAHTEPVVRIVTQKEIMSIREMQTFLNSLGHSRYYCGEVDGKPGPLLFKAWDNWTIDRDYKESTYGK